MSLSKQLIHLRNVKGISQEELAALMNVTRQSVSKWETDQALPDGEKIIRLSEIFSVTTDYLLKGTETAPIDIYSKHDSKAGAEMSAEVNEILNYVHSMTYKKRILIGIGLLFGIILIVTLLLLGIRM